MISSSMHGSTVPGCDGPSFTSSVRILGDSTLFGLGFGLVGAVCRGLCVMWEYVIAAVWQLWQLWQLWQSNGGGGGQRFAEGVSNQRSGLKVDESINGPGLR